GAQLSTRLVTSAKSWLSLGAADPRQPILPWGAPDDVRHVSPLHASARYLQHIREALDHATKQKRFVGEIADQEIFVTVPASFDAAARELTVEATKLAGLP